MSTIIDSYEVVQQPIPIIKMTSFVDSIAKNGFDKTIIPPQLILVRKTAVSGFCWVVRSHGYDTIRINDLTITTKDETKDYVELLVY